MRTIACVAATIGLLLAAGACKSKDGANKDEAKGAESPAAAAPVQQSPEERVCEHLVRIVDEGRYSPEECTKDVAGAKADCKSWDAFIECAMGAANEEALDACMEKCEG